MDIVTRGTGASHRGPQTRRDGHQPARKSKRGVTGIALAAMLLWANVTHAQAPDGAALARKLNCMSCHASDRTLLGPSLAEIRQRYANRPDDRDMLARKIQNGGSGSWGTVPMPANTQVNDEEAHALVDWILDPNR
ncbi:MAG TPA: c-type cytochrome [Pararobbsia sp.]|jgi:cytochrome c|nr:c-type cytochrome [Pararobbsia sp.]